MDKLKQNMYYLIITLVSLISLFFLPMLGSEIGLKWNIPNTSVGWVIWVTTKLIVASLNVLIFHCFMQQAKVNVKDNKNFLRAEELMFELKIKLKNEFTPRSPKSWTIKQYTSKGVTIFVTTALSTIAFAQALLTFDYVSLLTYLFTIVMGLIFGIMQMKSAEIYWTEEYLLYAKLLEKEIMEEKNNV